METTGHSLNSVAQSARAVIARLDARTQFDKEGDGQPPFWYDDVSALSAEWALILASAMDWLDRAPQFIVRAYMGKEDEALTAEFSRLTQDMQDLKKDALKEESDGNAFFYIGPKKETVGVRLEAALARKNKLDPKINEQMSRRRQALQITEDSNQLAAICADALPELLGDLDHQLSAVDIEQAASMAQAQSLVKKTKQLTRAREAIESVSRRISIALSSASASTHEELERSIYREEKAHGQLDLLCHEISSSVMRDQVNGSEQPQQSNSKKIDAPQKIHSAVKDAAGTIQKYSTSEIQAVTGAFQKMTRNMALSNDHWDELFSFFTKMLFYSNISAATPLSNPPGILINEVLKVLEGSDAPKDKGFLSIFTLINRSMEVAGPDCNGNTVIGYFPRPFFFKKGDPIQVKHIDWNRVKSLAIESLGFHPDEALDLLVTASRFDTSGLEFEAHHLNSLQGLGLSENSLKKAVQTFQALCAKQSFSDQLARNVELAWDIDWLSEHFSPSYCSRIIFTKCIALLDDQDLAKEYWFDFKDLNRLERKDLMDLAYELIARAPSPGIDKWMDAVLGTSIGISDLGAPITLETEWINTLNECEKRCRDGGVHRSICPNLLHHAISIENHALVKYLVNGCPQAKLDDVDVLGRGLHTFHDLLKMAAMPGTEVLPVDPGYWCKMFSSWLESPISMYDKEMGGYALSPLVFALRHGADDWAKALLEAGADPFSSGSNQRPIHEITRRVIDSLGLEEGVNIRNAESSVQEAYISILTIAMDKAGLWDIKGAVPKGKIVPPDGLDEFEARLLANIMMHDTRQKDLNPSQHRANAIKKYLAGLSKSQFMEVATFTIMLHDDDDQDLFRVFQYGVDAGVLKENKSSSLPDVASDLEQKKRCVDVPCPVPPPSRKSRF